MPPVRSRTQLDSCVGPRLEAIFLLLFLFPLSNVWESPAKSRVNSPRHSLIPGHVRLDRRPYDSTVRCIGLGRPSPSRVITASPHPLFAEGLGKYVVGDLLLGRATLVRFEYCGTITDKYIHFWVSDLARPNFCWYLFITYLVATVYLLIPFGIVRADSTMLSAHTLQ